MQEKNRSSLPTSPGNQTRDVRFCLCFRDLGFFSPLNACTPCNLLSLRRVPMQLNIYVNDNSALHALQSFPNDLGRRALVDCHFQLRHRLSPTLHVMTLPLWRFLSLLSRLPSKGNNGRIGCKRSTCQPSCGNVVNDIAP